MSLLNDMLRDLSHTQKSVEHASVSTLELQDSEQRELLNQSSVIKPEPGKVWPSVATFFCVLLVLWVCKSAVSEEGAERALEGVPADSAASLVETSAKLPRAVDAQDAASVNPALVESGQPDGSYSVVDHTRTTADTASPSADAINSSATLNDRLASLETAITKLSSAMEESQRAANGSAKVVLDEAEPVAAEASSLQATAVIAEPVNSVSIRDPFLPSQNVDQLNVQKPTTAEKVSFAETDANPQPANLHLSVTRNAESQDQRQAEQARQLVAQGQFSDAIIALQAFIAKTQVSQESTRVLLDIFVEQENVSAIEALLSHADYLNQLDKQFYSAKVAIIQQREDRAIELLEAQATEAEEREAYRALLAGLYQRAGKYAEAANAYRRMLGSFGEKPSYWLGFALAQDSLSQRQTARQAYLRVAEYADLQPEVRAYIQQRLLALQ